MPVGHNAFPVSGGVSQWETLCENRNRSSQDNSDHRAQVKTMPRLSEQMQLENRFSSFSPLPAACASILDVCNIEQNGSQRFCIQEYYG